MRVTNKLTALGVTRTKKPGRYGDGGGLYLQVTETGSRSWLFRYMRAGNAREMGLGSLQTWTLVEARERARQQRQLLDQGKDPLGERKQQQQSDALHKATLVSFEECAEDYITDQKPGWKNEKHAEQWTSTLKNWVYPIVGKLPVGGITTDLVLKVLKQPISDDPDAPAFWLARTETASRVRGRIEKVLGWAGTRGLRDGENPARWRGHLEHLLPAPSTVAPVEHHPALPYKRVGEFWADLRDRDGVGARALEFTILNVTRTEDTIGALWAEIDEEERIWTIPAARMKGQKGRRKRDHIIPLSDAAMQLLADLPRSGEYVFATDVGRLSNAAMAAVIDRMNEERAAAGLPRWTDPQEADRDIVPHGFRSSLTDWATEQTNYPNEMVRLAKAHTVSDKVEAAYRRGDMREKRRRMMTHWARYCSAVAPASRETSDRDRVVPIRA